MLTIAFSISAQCKFLLQLETYVKIYIIQYQQRDQPASCDIISS